MPALKIFSSFRAGGILDVKRIQRTRMAEDAVNLPEGTPRELTEEELVKVFACCKCRSAQIDSVQNRASDAQYEDANKHTIGNVRSWAQWTRLIWLP